MYEVGLVAHFSDLGFQFLYGNFGFGDLAFNAGVVHSEGCFFANAVLPFEDLRV